MREKIKPGFRSYLRVLGLLFETLVSLLILPFHLAVFLVQRKRVTHEIQNLLEDQRRK